MTYFLDLEHQESFNEFILEANISEKEYTAKAIVYVLSSLPTVKNNIERFYSLKGKYIVFDGIESMNLSSGESSMIAFAFNLYNGHKEEDVDLSPAQLLSNVDKSLRQVIIQAMSFKIGLTA